MSSQRRPRTRYFTGTKKMKNKHIYNNDYEIGSYFAGLMSLSDQEPNYYQRATKFLNDNNFSKDNLMLDYHNFTFSEICVKNPPKDPTLKTPQ